MQATDIFQFRQFRLRQAEGVFPTGTDGVLLGAWAHFEEDNRILDIGTGTGLIALMAAQRNSKATIDAIDVNPEAVSCAQFNFSQSPWKNRLTAQESALQVFQQQMPQTSYTHIISNPPFFEAGPKAPEPQRAMARHTDALPFSELLDAVCELLHPKGRFSCILPYPTAQSIKEMAALQGLYFSRETLVFPTLGKKPNRTLLEFRKTPAFWGKQTLILYETNGEQAVAYKNLCGDFYL